MSIERYSEDDGCLPYCENMIKQIKYDVSDCRSDYFLDLTRSNNTANLSQSLQETTVPKPFSVQNSTEKGEYTEFKFLFGYITANPYNEDNFAIGNQSMSVYCHWCKNRLMKATYKQDVPDDVYIKTRTHHARPARIKLADYFTYGQQMTEDCGFGLKLYFQNAQTGKWVEDVTFAAN